jgi:hypothetical protein
MNTGNGDGTKRERKKERKRKGRERMQNMVKQTVTSNLLRNEVFLLRRLNDQSLSSRRAFLFQVGEEIN